MPALLRAYSFLIPGQLMQIKVLGSAAGGGFPQWNCNCENCRGVRAGTIKASRRTQSSIAVSDNGTEWVLCNVSPDICHQILATPELSPPPGVLRGTGIGAIILTDSQIDHSAGLLNLREGCPHQVWCTDEVHQDLTSGFPVFNILSHWNGGLEHHLIVPGRPFSVAVSRTLQFTPIPLLSNAPPYSAYRDRPLPGHNIALFIEDGRSGKTLLYAPGLGDPDDVLMPWLRKADCLLIDGTLWRDNELALTGVGRHTGKDMGHLALGEEQGLAALLASLPAQRKILIHINNTNPILDEDSAERQSLTRQGIEVSRDGMLIEV
ncbi:pyrroloquinoline quinone biosynthesis protein B [Sodalis ligni]|jgi:pyrroloquinoline quinone biosynthesis protein B|uniref:Coenzyme PQQ synthesis protein B n=2 Tax=Bruguierivoracaceae TaxID=2812006 RepID=A0A4R1N9H8_9GAMM|nr:pyrroloquinoline quinone biosynthesis protein B [Sodalis ligni]